MKLVVPPYTFEVTRKKIRSLRLRITPEGKLRLSIPLNASVKDAERFAASHLGWIEQKLAELSSRREREQQGMKSIFGTVFKVDIRESDHEHLNYADGILTIDTAHPENDTHVRSMIESFRFQVLESRTAIHMQRYAEMLGTEVPPYHFREMKSRWGSYSTKTGRISLNTRLINLDERCLAYVAAHELCHIFHPDHSASFHRLLDQIMPENRDTAKLFR